MRDTHRRMLQFSAICAAVAMAAGCSGGSPDGDGDEPVTLSVLVETTAADESPYKTITDLYSEQNPDVTFDLEYVPINDLGQVLRTRLQGGNGPDLFYVTGGSGNVLAVLPFAEADYVLDLAGTPAAEILPDNAKGLFYRGDEGPYAQALEYVPISHMFNDTATDAAGVSHPDTIDELLEQCSVANDAGVPLIQLAGASSQNAGGMTMQIAASRVYAADPDWDVARMAGEVTFADSEEWARSLQLAVDLFEAGCMQNGAEGGGIEQNVPALASGQALSIFGPGQLVTEAANVNPDQTFRAYPLPGDTAEDTRIFASPSNALAANAALSGARKDAALDFLAWLAEPQQAAAYTDLTGNIPISAIGGDGAVPPQFEALGPYLQDESRFQPLANLFWPSPEVYNTLGIGVQGLLTGQTTVDQVLASLDAAWDQAS